MSFATWQRQPDRSEVFDNDMHNKYQKLFFVLLFNVHPNCVLSNIFHTKKRISLKYLPFGS